MKITLVVGGRWNAFDLARELHGRGCLHRLITNYLKSKTRVFGIPDDKVVSLPLSLLIERAAGKISGGKLDVPMQYFRHQLFANAAARHLEGSDLVHFWSSFGDPLIPWCRAQGVPVIVERLSSHILAQSRILAQEQGLLGLNQRITHPGIEAMEQREYERADRIVVPSGFVKDTFVQEGVSPEKMYLNPFGVSLDQFKPGPGSKSGFTAIYAGTLSYRKGVHYLKEGFLQARLPDASLVLVGGAVSETPRLLAGAHERIKAIGHIPQAELVSHYQRADVFAIASIEEGLAMVQAQALACGLPLVCTTNTGGEDLLRLISDEDPRDLEGGIREYPAGYVAPIRDPGALAWCLRTLYENPELLAHKREAALNIRKKRLDWGAHAARIIELYRALGV